MSGKIALDDGIYPIEQLVAHTRRVQLSPMARGRIVVGDSTLIFQFVDRPITPAKPQLPLAVKSAVFDRVDWQLTIIVAVSFLAHFGVMGSMYSDWSDPIVNESYTVQGLVDLSPALPAPPIEVKPESDVQTPVNPTPVKPEDTRRADNAPSPSPRPNHADNSASLADQGERMRMSMMLSFGSDKPAVRQVFNQELPAFALPHPDASLAPDSAITLHTDAPMAFNTHNVDLSKYVQTHTQSNDHATPRARRRSPPPRSP